MMVIRRKMKNMHCKARTFRPHDRQNITFGLFCIIVVVVFWSTTWAKWSVRSATISSNRDIHLSYAAMGSPWDEGKARGHFVVPKIKKNHITTRLLFISSGQASVVAVCAGQPPSTNMWPKYTYILCMAVYVERRPYFIHAPNMGHINSICALVKSKVAVHGLNLMMVNVHSSLASRHTVWYSHRPA